MALHRALRLRKNSDFQRVRQQGRFRTSRLLVLMYAPNGEGQNRIGFTVSKQIAKEAVRRNYVKRLLGEAVRTLLSDISPGWDIVFRARAPILQADIVALKHDIAVLLREARLLTPSNKGEESS